MWKLRNWNHDSLEKVTVHTTQYLQCYCKIYFHDHVIFYSLTSWNFIGRFKSSKWLVQVHFRTWILSLSFDQKQYVSLISTEDALRLLTTYDNHTNPTQSYPLHPSDHTWYLSFFYTHTFSGLKILHSKVRKFATKIALRQNSVNHYSRAIFHTLCKITHCA